MNLSKSCSFLKMRRKKHLNSILGTFYEDTKTIDIKNYDLDSFEDSIDSWLNYTTFFHEQMHYYQFASSSLGLFLTCLEDLKFELILPFISELDYTPPFIGSAENKEREFNAEIRKIRQKYGIDEDPPENYNFIGDIFNFISEIDLIMWILEGGFTHDELEPYKKEVNSTLKFLDNIYYYLFQLYEHTGKDLSTIYDDLKKEIQKINLPKKDIILIKMDSGESLGYNQILEAHSRYCELTRLTSYIYRYKETRVLKSVKKILTTQDYYQDAYNMYKSIVVNIGECDELFDIFIFCLICDYAINIPIPQTPQITDSILVLYDFNYMTPGLRFINICRAVNSIFLNNTDTDINSIGDYKLLELGTLDDWSDFIKLLYDRISEKTGYASPLSIAKAFIDNEYKFDISSLQHAPFDYDNFIFLEACKIRLEHPLFFINPELFRLIDREKYIEISNSQGPRVMKVKKGFATLYNNKIGDLNDEEKGRRFNGYLIKNILTTYYSGLFYGCEQDVDPNKIFMVKTQDAEKVINDKFGKIKRFW